jgi:sugar-specific transcriptional regulator TrmB
VPGLDSRLRTPLRNSEPHLFRVLSPEQLVHKKQDKVKSEVATVDSLRRLLGLELLLNCYPFLKLTQLVNKSVGRSVNVRAPEPPF